MSAAIHHGRVHGVCVFATAVALVTLGPGFVGAQGQGHCPMHQPRGQGAGQGQHHHGCAGCGRQAAQAQPGGDDHAADREVFHYLLDQGDKVKRTVTVRADGIETLTESDDPAVAEKIRQHVASMYDRVKEGRPIHQRDPLFRALFAHADKIDFESEPTVKGVKVVETSSDPHVARLIQAHAEVVSKFIEHGRREAMTDHEVPTQP